MSSNGNGSEPLTLDRATLRKCSLSPRDMLQNLKIWPNDLRYHQETQTGVLVVPQSKTWAEYAMSEAGLNYLHDAVRNGKIAAGVVVLVDRRGEIVGCKPIADVAAMVQEVTPREGSLGPYWWLNRDFTLNVQGILPTEPLVREVPF